MNKPFAIVSGASAGIGLAARLGFDARMSGEGLAEQHRRKAEPGGGRKRRA